MRTVKRHRAIDAPPDPADDPGGADNNQENPC
jgi:hypothetical protein